MYTNSLSNLRFRAFRGETDYPVIAGIINGCKEVDGMNHSTTLEDVRNQYAHLVNSDPARDLLFAEVEEVSVGYVRASWRMDAEGNWLGFSVGYVLPDYRRRGIGRNLLDFAESRLKEISSQQIASGQLSTNARRYIYVTVSEKECDTEALLKHAGYQVIRYFYEMVRPDLENIPDLPLPPGIEVRPVLPEHYRPIFDAANEAFRDHWCYIPDPEEEFQKLQADANFDPSLWRVAWAGDQIAGMVQSFINKAENREYNRKRGYTENICVLRPWRKQGLAKALIAMSLKAIKERGMDHAALGVDAENTSGATHLYEKMGYRVVERGIIYSKSF